MRSWAIVVVGLYGLFSLAGGVIGYVKAKSRSSLIAGTASGFVLLLCASGLRQGHRAAAIGSLLIAVALGGRFLEPVSSIPAATQLGPARRPTIGCGGQARGRRCSSSTYRGSLYAVVVAPWPRGLGARNAARAD